MNKKISLQMLNKPRKKDIDSDVDWFCDSFGFSSGRDLGNTTSKIIRKILEEIKKHAGISTDEIAQSLKIKPARVNHHVRGLMNSGFLYRKKKLIFLRGGSLKQAVVEMQKDANRMFNDLEEIAQEMDAVFGIKNR